MSGQNEKPVLKVNPEVIIRGQPMDVVSVVEDDHGVIWVSVKPSACRLQCSTIRRQALKTGK